jgi:hypothetical protein
LSAGPPSKKAEGRLTPAEVELVLRRAAELSARRRRPVGGGERTVSPEVLVQAAATAGIDESDVRRALFDLYSEKAVEPETLAKRLYGSARLRIVREMDHPVSQVRTHIEDLLRREQGLRLRRKTEASSLWDAGDLLGAVRRALDFSGARALLKARSVELRVEEVGEGRSGANLTADVSNQRSDYLSLGGILGATLAVPLAIAGFVEWPYLLAVPPAVAASGFGFRLAYMKACADMRRALDAVLDAAEEGPPGDRAGRREERRVGPPGRIQRLKPIPRFAHPPDEDE